MKKLILIILFLIDLSAFSQSSIIYDAGSSVDVQTGADVCADVITIHGVYSGGGSICSGALPVTLSLFNALSVKNNVTLNWKTEMELNNSGFYVQRKSEMGEWQELAFIEGSGTVNHPVEYTYEDKKLLPGKYYYRLKQTDYNGNFEYFDLELPVIISKPSAFDISQNYPNPSNPNSRIDFQLPEKVKVNISVYDLLGRLIAVLIDEERDAGAYSVEFNGTNISSGTYFYKITAGDFNQIKKLVLIK